MRVCVCIEKAPNVEGGERANREKGGGGIGRNGEARALFFSFREDGAASENGRADTYIYITSLSGDDGKL